MKRNRRCCVLRFRNLIKQLGKDRIVLLSTLVTAAVTGVLDMVLSEAFHSGLATLAVFTGWIIAGLVIQIPLQSRVFSQIWDWMPTTFLSVWNIFDVRTVSLFGHRLVSWQIVPVLYLLGGLLAFLAGVRVYRRYQVSGR